MKKTQKLVQQGATFTRRNAQTLSLTALLVIGVAQTTYAGRLFGTETIVLGKYTSIYGCFERVHVKHYFLGIFLHGIKC